MKVLLSGSSGLVGSALKAELDKKGFDVALLVRKKTPGDSKQILWDIDKKTIEHDKLAGIDCVIHLAGENIASTRWTSRQKNKILRSRIEGTKLLATALARLEKPPETFLCASAVGYYGDRGSEMLDEDSSVGQGFLSSVVSAWEESTAPLSQSTTRVVNLRFGMILSKHGGALKKMLLPFKLGIAGKIGSGSQYLSWITLEDVVKAISYCIEIKTLSGAVNIVSPNPVTNVEFTRTLGWVLRRPTFFPLPAVVAKAILGEMAEELLLASTRVQPKKLLENGFTLEHPDLETALRYLLKNGCK